MVNVLVILDGATDAPDAMEQSLDAARMPALHRLRREGELTWVDNVDPRVPVGSETAIAALLGWRPDGPVDRGLVEAAARGIEPAPGERVWRVDVPEGHRLLLIAPPPLPRIDADVPVRVWPEGLRPPRMLGDETVVVGAAGAATGLGRLMGARVVIPAGATGRPGSDLAGKRRAALEAIRDRATRVVVHVGGADEAAHARDREAKIAVLEAADRELIGPLTEAVEMAGGELAVCPDHGCDPGTGGHVGGPVPHVRWCCPHPAGPPA